METLLEKATKLDKGMKREVWSHWLQHLSLYSSNEACHYPRTFAEGFARSFLGQGHFELLNNHHIADVYMHAFSIFCRMYIFI